MRGRRVRRDVGVLPELAVVAEGLTLPTLANDVYAFAQAPSALTGRDTPAIVLDPTVALHEPEAETPAGHQWATAHTAVSTMTPTPVTLLPCRKTTAELLRNLDVKVTVCGDLQSMAGKDDDRRGR